MREHVITWKKITALFLMLLSLTLLLFVAGRANPIIEIEDEQFELVVREKLNRPTGFIYETDLLTITELNASDSEIVSLSGIERFTRLVDLNLDNNMIEDLSPLENLSMLRSLSLENNSINNLEDINFYAISHLDIRELSLANNKKDAEQLSDVSLLSNLNSLEVLNFSNNHIEDLAPLANLVRLESINLSGNKLDNLDDVNFDSILHLPIKQLDLSDNEYDGNQLTDISLVKEIRTLEELNLKGNAVNDVSPLAFLTNLEKLNLRDNQITDLEAVNFNEITHLPLSYLSLRHNVYEGDRIADISLLEELTLLKELELRDNHIEDLSPLSSLTKLEVVDLRENRITDIQALSGLINLQELDLRLNLIEDLSHLGNLQQLEKLDLRQNSFTDVEILAELGELKELNLRENAIASIDALANLVHLEYLNIHSNNEIHSLQAIKNLTNLETLIMRNVPINDELYVFEELVNLQNLNALGTGIMELETKDVVSNLRAQGALQGEVIPKPILHTIDSPSFSESDSFHENEINVEIISDVNDGEIYYTTDGSSPTDESNRYNEGDQIALQYQSDDEPTILRAKVISSDNNISETITQTYFIDDAIFERFSLPVVSIATDKENFFDEERGIYRSYNANKRGRDWERPIHIEFFEPDGTPGFSQNAGARIHGGATRVYRQKTLRIYADNEYDTQDAINYDLFRENDEAAQDESGIEFKRILLRNSGNDWGSTMFRDAMLQSLVEPLDTMDIQKYRPSIVFLNGEYWGIHNIRERYDEYYVANEYNVPVEDVVILERDGVLDKGNAGGEEHYQEMLDYIESHGVEDEENFEYVETKMDTINFRDYIIAETFFGNTDWPHGNIRYWRLNSDNIKENAPIGHDGRWRWMLFDTDFGFGRYASGTDRQGNQLDYTHNTIDWVINEFSGRLEGRTWPNFLIRSMLANETYRIDFLSRYADLLNSYFDPQVVIETINNMQNTIEPEMENHINRWNAINSMESWYDNVEYLRIFANKRPDYIRQYLMEEFNINGTVMLSLNTAQFFNQGSVKVNTLKIDETLPGWDGTSMWQGEYFEGVPIQLTAESYPGYTFSHWEGLDEVYSDETIAVSLTQDTSIRPIFRKNNE